MCAPAFLQLLNEKDINTGTPKECSLRQDKDFEITWRFLQVSPVQIHCFSVL